MIRVPPGDIRGVFVGQKCGTVALIGGLNAKKVERNGGSSIAMFDHQRVL